MTRAAFARCWHSSFPRRFAISPEAAWHQAYGSEHFRPDWSAELYHQAGEAAAILVAKQGTQSGTAHVSALLGEPMPARTLLSECLHTMCACGVHTVRFGSDPDHFWPGAPVGVSWLSELLVQAGFTLGSEIYDMGRDLDDYAPLGTADALGASVVRCNPADVPALGRFLTAEFPGRWETDTVRKAAEDPGDIFILLVDGTIQGFTVTQTPRSKRPHAGAVFRSDLGFDWCALGPIGVAATLRGKRLGDALLSEALLSLRETGGRDCTIDWTVLTEFYGRHGFRPTATYRAAELRLAPVS